MKIDWKEAADAVAEAVLEAEVLGRKNGWTGAQKRKHAIDTVTPKLDAAVTWGDGALGRALERADGPVIHLVATALVEGSLAMSKLLLARLGGAGIVGLLAA